MNALDLTGINRLAPYKPGDWSLSHTRLLYIIIKVKNRIERLNNKAQSDEGSALFLRPITIFLEECVEVTGKCVTLQQKRKKIQLWQRQLQEDVALTP